MPLFLCSGEIGKGKKTSPLNLSIGAEQHHNDIVSSDMIVPVGMPDFLKRCYVDYVQMNMTKEKRDCGGLNDIVWKTEEESERDKMFSVDRLEPINASDSDRVKISKSFDLDRLDYHMDHVRE